MRLTINLATRGRPELLLKTIERTCHNIQDPNTFFMISVDRDDAETLQALDGTLRHLRPPPYVDVGAREDSLGAKYNRCLQVAPADVYLTMVDYRPFITPGFDKKILEAVALYPDGYAVVYNDMANWSFPGMNAVTHKLATRMGGIYPEYFPVWFIDHWLDDIARMIGRIVYCDVKQDTLPRQGMTQNLRDCKFWTAFYDHTASEREEIAAGIIGGGDFMMPEYAKQALMRNFPLIRQRSEGINGIVAQTPDQVEDNEAHQRLRFAAMSRLRWFSGAAPSGQAA